MRYSGEIKVILLSFIISLLLFFVLSYSSFNSYQTTITRVFNIEKSILGEFLPYKLSQAMINNEPDYIIQEMLDSNKKVFNIIVTDCPNSEDICPEQKILFTQNNFYDLSLLENQTWFALRDPAPLYREKELIHYNTGGFRKTEYENFGKIIGRVYFVERQSFTNRTLFSTLEFWLNKIPKRIFHGVKSNDSYMYDRNSIVSISIFVILCLLGIIQIRRNKEKIESTKSIRKLKKENLHLINEKKVLDEDLGRLEKQKKEQEMDIENLKSSKERLLDELKILEEKYNFVLNYTMANKFLLESEFAAPLNNHIQKLDLIIKGLAERTQLDIKDALHDINKAPLLRDENITTNNTSETLQEQLIKSRDTILWTVENINKLTSLNTYEFDLYEAVKEFYDKRPPAANMKDIQVNLIKQDNKPLIINANPYHIQSIVKNVIYNASAELNKVKRLYRRNPEKFQGNIDIICGEYNNEHVFVRIADNGGGVPEDFIDKLYESAQKVNPNSGKLEGNGSLIVSSYLSMYNGRVVKTNTNGGFEVTFIFRKTMKGE